ncbi:replication protein A 32 kDa subunit B-like [Lolium perenne]|uniref:replication protein A 32 kDa subunit B-like n=1 Tax=Lolium perenne TaxID=4522 RepID=UPI0021F55ABE|nr:replication protein A 32 kDa subunit B-like [Lolium perenne]
MNCKEEAIEEDPADLPGSGAIVPVSSASFIRILDAWKKRKGSVLVVNNTVLSTVRIIGRIRSKIADDRKGSFKIEDCTGEIKAVIWFTCSRQELDCIQDDSYAKVVGRIKLDGSIPEILCYSCKIVTDFNDITHHHLSVIATHVDLVHRPITGFPDTWWANLEIAAANPREDMGPTI